MSNPARAPLIGLNCDTFGDAQGVITGVRQAYCQAIERAGGIPLLIPHLTERTALERVLDAVDGVVLVGGDDISVEKLSALAGRAIARAPHAAPMSALRERSDFLLLELLLERRERAQPVLGVCLANQELAVLHGGELRQHLPEELPGIAHGLGPTEGPAAGHAVRVEPGSLLETIWGSAQEVQVNSAHHQGVTQVRSGVRPVAWAPDGVIEALQVEGHPFFLTVQWHPERMAEDTAQRKLFEALVHAAAQRG